MELLETVRQFRKMLPSRTHLSLIFGSESNSRGRAPPVSKNKARPIAKATVRLSNASAKCVLLILESRNCKTLDFVEMQILCMYFVKGQYDIRVGVYDPRREK